MKRTAFACPLYDMRNHFDLAINLFESKIKYNIENDLYFIFSNEAQKDKFYHLLKQRNIEDQFKYLIEPENYLKYHAQAVAKKFYALEVLKDLYDYIILVDSESLFIKNCDFDSLANEIWEKKTMLNSNKSYDGFFIMRDCFKTMGIYKNKRLRKDTENFKYNFWFNDLQVYPSNYLHGFFTWLDNYNKEKVYDNPNCFEYYVFYAYLLLEYDIHIKKFPYESMGGVNEYLDLFSKEDQINIINKMDFHWTSSKNAITKNVVMLFHLDRNDEGYGYDALKDVKRFEIKRKILLLLHK